MLVHGTFPLSTVNGPGDRAVVWFQGCLLACENCWNPRSHPFSADTERSVEEIGEWVLSLSDIEGVTISGGEPFQQAADLLELCAYLKSQRPDLSIGLFSGYTLAELETGRWTFTRGASGEWLAGSPDLFAAVKQHLDFGVFGRFNRHLSGSDKPLCGSRNQSVVFFTGRYSERDIEQQSCEINIAANGELVTITGFPPSSVEL